MDSSSVAAGEAIRKIRLRTVQKPCRATFLSRAQDTVPIWFVKTLALACVGIALVFAVVKTASLMVRHEVSGKSTLAGKPLGRVSLRFTCGDQSYSAVSSVDGSFKIKGLRPGLYSVFVWPGESGVKIPKRYLSPATSPLRFEVLEDLQGMQISISP